jgi:hypothetical protein
MTQVTDMVNRQVTDQVTDQVIAQVNSPVIAAKKELDFNLIKSLLEQLDEQSRLMDDEIEDEQAENGDVAGQVKENVFLNIAANKGGTFGKWVLAERIAYRGELNGDPDYGDAPIFYSRGYEIAPGNKELMAADKNRIQFTDRILNQ